MSELSELLGGLVYSSMDNVHYRAIVIYHFICPELAKSVYSDTNESLYVEKINFDLFCLLPGYSLSMRYLKNIILNLIVLVIYYSVLVIYKSVLIILSECFGYL